MKKLLIIITLGIFVAGCGKKNVQLEEDLAPRFDKAMDSFERDKFLRAKDEFDYIILTDPGSKIANESQYYKKYSKNEPNNRIDTIFHPTTYHSVSDKSDLGSFVSEFFNFDQIKIRTKL